jgi:hypothetical protein
LQKPHHAVRQQISKLHSEVYVSARVSQPLIPIIGTYIHVTNHSHRAAGPPRTTTDLRLPTSSPRSTASQPPTLTHSLRKYARSLTTPTSACAQSLSTTSHGW